MIKEKRSDKWNLWIFAAVVVITLSLSIVHLRNVEREIERETSDTLQEVSIQTAALVKERISNDLFILERLGAQISREAATVTDDAALARIQDASENNPHFSHIVTVSKDGQLHRWDKDLMVDIKTSEPFRRMMLGENVVYTMQIPLEDEDIGETALTKISIILGVPLWKNGAVWGALLGRYDSKASTGLVNARIYGGQGYQYMASSDGVVFISSDHPSSNPNFHNISTDFNDAKFLGCEGAEKIMANMRENKGGYVLFRRDSMDRFLCYTPVGVNDWYLLTVVPRELIVSRSARLFRQSMLLSICFVGLFLCVIYLLLRAELKNRRELEMLHNAVPGAIFRCKYDEALTILSANGSFYDFLGYSPEEFSLRHQNSMTSVIYPDDLENTRYEMRHQLKESGITVNQYRLVCRNGEARWIWVKGKTIENIRGDKEIYCVFMDITELKQMERQSTLNQQRYEMIMDQTQDTVFEWNPSEGTLDYSKNFSKKFGFELCSTNFPGSLLSHIHEEDQDAFLEATVLARDGGKAITVEFRILKVDGKPLWCRIVMSAIQDGKGHIVRVIGMLTDIDAQKQQLRRMEIQASTDPLTKLYNRGAAEEIIQRYLDNSIGGLAALLVIDVDNFKSVNDVYGHQHGDKVLKGIADALLSQFRGSDVVSRIGGDEFIVFMTNLPEEYKIGEKARQLLRSFIGRNSHIFSCSIGIALYPQDATTYEELFDKADQALYAAKEHGKNCYQIYSDKES